MQGNDSDDQVPDHDDQVPDLQARLQTLELQGKEERERYQRELKKLYEGQMDQLTTMTRAIQREFRLSGQIGEHDQKDKLAYLSVLQQVDSAEQRGISNRDIISSVIRAIVPGTPLRSYLEGKTDITLAVLRRTLQLHYRGQSASDLYNTLVRAVQAPKEDPQEFVLRVFDLRQKLVMAAKEEEPAIYDTTLISSVTNRTIGAPTILHRHTTCHQYQ